MSRILPAKRPLTSLQANGRSHDDCGWVYEVLLGMAFPPTLVPYQAYHSDSKVTTLQRNVPPAGVSPGTLSLQK